MMHIKKMSAEHIDSVYEIEKTCFSRPWSIENLKEQLDYESSYFYVAVIDDAVVGYMGLQIFAGDGYVTNVAVLPDFRGQGIATALLKRSFENKMNFISLEVRESNVPAISLYEKLGFEHIGIRPNFYAAPQENAVIMTKGMNDENTRN